jgi:molybdopterin adenylyltransferase
MKKKLSHYDERGQAKMVDVSAKADTKRTAMAHAFVRIKPSVLQQLPKNPKGNPLEVARFAGISAAKKTAELIPMCHPLMLSHGDGSAHSGGCGGLDGLRHDQGVGQRHRDPGCISGIQNRWDVRRLQAEMIRVAIVTVSDSAVAGTREDRSGPALVAKVQELGWQVAATKLVGDERERISSVLEGFEHMDVVLTTGGTGVAPRDVTPEATSAIADRKIEGMGELMRLKGLEKTRFAPLSRAGAYTRGEVLIVNLPGSPKGAVESLEAVAGLIPHVVDLLHGRTEHGA